MKIDFEMLEVLVATGASGAVVLAFLREQHDRKAPRRVKDKVRKRAEKVRKNADQSGMAADTNANADRDAATLADTPRARLFREARPALQTLNISSSRAGALIVGWLKLTNDDDQLVLATILRAQALAVADAPGWILATLKGKTNGNGTGTDRTNQAAQPSGSATIMAGVAAAAERRGRERAADRSGGPVPRDADAAREPDFEFGGTPHG